MYKNKFWSDFFLFFEDISFISIENDVKKKNSLNVGTIGHVDHGKTTLTAALTQVASCYYGVDGVGQRVYSYEEIDRTREEQERGITINATHVEYTTFARNYVHVDCPGHESYIKNMITGAMQLDVAIVVVSAWDGPQKQTREHLILAKQIGLNNLIIFMNKLDAFIDGDILEIVMFEVLELIEGLDFYNIEWICGSALNAMLAPLSFWGESIRSILDVLDNNFITTLRNSSTSFLMPVKESFSVTGRGTVVTGFVEQGQLKVNDEVEIIGLDEKKIKTTCIGIEAFNKKLDLAEAGLNVGLLLRGIHRNDISRGQVVCLPGTQKIASKILADIYILKPEEGGRKKPIYEGYSPQLYIRTANVKVIISFENKIFKTFLIPGEISDVVLYIDNPLALSPGLRFALREGLTTIGWGLVNTVLE